MPLISIKDESTGSLSQLLMKTLEIYLSLSDTPALLPVTLFPIMYTARPIILLITISHQERPIPSGHPVVRL